MFTGIVRALGAVKSIRPRGDGDGDGCTLVVDIGALAGDSAAGSAAASVPIRIGDSIAVNGACLTVAELRGGDARFEVSPETLARCLVGEWGEGKRLNLEPALTLQTPLGGHLVAGHIDGAGVLLERRQAGAWARLEFEAPRAIGRLLADKGAVAVDGVSLTTNRVRDRRDRRGWTRFEVMLVPHTLESTTLGALQPGARVHLEADPLARYAQRLAACGDGSKDGNDSDTKRGGGG